MKRQLLVLSILMLAAALPVPAMGVNSSIEVEHGEFVEGDLSTVNGNIEIEDGATVKGDAESVNGKIEVGRDVQVESVSAVNGRIEIGEGAVVDGEVETVNGPISMENGSRAEGVGTVNGSIRLTGADIDGDVSTYNGEVKLREGTVIGGDIRVLEPRGKSHGHERPLRIYIEDGSTVQGNVIVEDADRRVEVHLRGGSVAGEVRGAKVVEN